MDETTLLDGFLAAVEAHGYRVAYVRDDKARVQCPVHGDRVPSLDVKAVPGTLVLICRALECDVGDVLAALDLTFRDIYLDAGRAVRAEKSDRQRRHERAYQRLIRMCERAEQLAELEAMPEYWLRRAEAFATVGTEKCDAIAQACRNKAEVVTW